MSASNREGFGAETTTDQVLEGIELSGKLALITGGSSGLGAETARAFAAKGARVVLTARDLAAGKEVADGIKASTGNQNVEVEELELGSLASIRAFAGRFLAKHDALQILVNNAGVMACEFDKTSDGFEMQFGTNHLGHFLMTGLIAPALLRGAPSRVVSLSSRGHHIGPVNFDDLHFEQREYEKWESYGQAKTANILFAVELERRLGERGVHANAVHPGVIMTKLSRHMGPDDFAVLQKRATDRGEVLSMKPVEAGAATSVFTATAPELEGRGGLYLEDCHVAEIDDTENAGGGVRSYAVDAENARQLWAVSEKMVGETFSF